MLRKALVFPNTTKMRDAFHKFKDEHPDNMYFTNDFKVVAPNAEITFLCPDRINERLRGCNFHEIVVVEKIWLSQEEMTQLQMCVVPTNGQLRVLGGK